MKSVLRILLLVIFGAGAAKAEVPGGWSTNLALLSDSTNRPSLLFFTADWCGPCRLMARTTLTNALVQQALESFAHVAVDIDAHPDLAEQREIRAVPTFLILSASGEEVGRTTGFEPAEAFYPWLTNSLDLAEAALARHSRSLDQLREFDRMAGGTHAESDSLARTLFALCADRDPDLVEAAVARLKQLAARDPVVVLEGLNDPRLATRIRVANILRAQLGESFQVDPWSSASDRTRQVTQWRQQLAK